MAFSHLFRRYSTSNEMQSTCYTYSDLSSTAETLLDELESQCQNCSTLLALQKRNSQVLNSSGGTLAPPGSTLPAKRHSSVDYSWLTPNNNLLQSTHDLYHLSDIIKMELSELIRNVLPEDCAVIINTFRRHLRSETKSNTPENVIALFRKTIAEHIDEKPKHRTSTTTTSNSHSLNETHQNHQKLHGKINFVRNNRINPKRQADDEQHCIAELTEISISSSSNDGTENKHQP